MKKYIKNVWFKLRIFYGKIMNSIALPTVDDEGEYIDKDRVQCAYIFNKDGIKLIHCFVDGVLYILCWTPELERWFSASGIPLPMFDNIPENGIVATVDNVPEKYKKKPQPK